MTGVASRTWSADRHRFGFWAVAYAFVVLMAFSTSPSPLYVLYARRDHLSSLLITLIYAAYAVGVLGCLFFVSHLSDVHGRRPHLLVAVALAVVSAVMFIAWPTLAGLFAARVLCGISVGLTVSTATAYLNELHLADRPGSATARPQLAATVSNLGGLSLGALVAGLLAQYVVSPLVVPYAVVLGMLVIAGVALAITPETRARARPLPAYRPQRASAPEDARPQFYAALLGVFLAYAPPAIFTSLSGTFLVTVVHDRSLATAGATIFVFFGVGAAFLVSTRTWPVRRLLAVGVVVEIIGLGLVVVSAWLPSPSLALFLVGGAVAGAAAAALFRGTMGSVIGIASSERLGEALAAFFLSGYLGLSVPAIAVGIALQYLSARDVLLAFAIAVIAGILGASRIVLGARQPGREASA